MNLKPLKRIPNDESAQHSSDAELRNKLNELIDNSNAQIDEIVYLRGQVTLLAAQVTALRHR
jgi:hypothetical protein